MKRTGTSERYPASPTSSATASGAHGANAAHAQANLPDNSRTAAEKKPALHTRPAAGAAQTTLAGHTPGAERREQYIERGQQPSFEFANIEDEHVLKVVAAQRSPTWSPPGARQVQTEEARQLSGIAAAIQKTMEGEVATVLRELARLAPAEGAGQTALQDAKKRFALFIQQFRQAKLAAANGNRSDMRDALRLALDELDGLAGRHGAKSARQAGAPRIFNAATRAAVHALAQACSGWAETDNPLSRPGSASVRADADSPAGDSAEARARSVSSPTQVKKSEERERGRSSSAQTPPHGKALVGSAPAERQARQDETAAPKSPTSTGKKLRSLFSRGSESRTRAPGADSDPGSPRSRSGVRGSAETTTASTPEVALGSLWLPEKNRDSDDD